MYSGSTCWPLTSVGNFPPWMPPDSDPSYANADGSPFLYKDGQCTISKNPAWLNAECHTRADGNCYVSICFGEATGESWYFQNPRCYSQPDNSPRYPQWRSATP
jgi:hypothetical protein